MPENDSLRARIAAVVVGELLGQAEARADYASYDFDPKKPTRNLVHLDTSIDPDSLADAVIRELEADYILVPKSHTLARREKPPLFGRHLAVGDDGPIMLNINPKDADE